MLDTTRPAPDHEWLTPCEAAFADLLRAPRFVVNAPNGAGLASCAVGTYVPRFPSPHQQRSVFHGEIHSVATDPAWRRRGYGLAVATATMQWLASQDCSSARRNASPERLPLYAQLGFRPIPAPAMTWTCR